MIVEEDKKEAAADDDMPKPVVNDIQKQLSMYDQNNRLIKAKT